MSKKLSIMEQIEQMSKELDRLQGIKRLFERAVHDEFGLSVSEIHKILNDRQKMLKKNAEKRTAQSQQTANPETQMQEPKQPVKKLIKDQQAEAVDGNPTTSPQPQQGELFQLE